MKRCTKCGEEKALTEFSPRKGRRSGYRSHCKSCAAAARRARLANDPALRERNVRSAKEWREKNPERAKQGCKEWHAKNAEYIREWNRRYAKDNAGVIAARRRTYYEARRVEIQQYHKDYRERNAGRCAALSVARKRRTRAATPPWITPEDLAPFYDAARKAGDITGEPHQVDHIIPIRHPLVCGLNVPWNLRVIDAAWNNEKRNKFYPERGRAT
jgi:hypothetical protein